jgi:hypothetical protein
MKKTGLFFITFFIAAVTFCQTNPAIAIVPEPVKIEQKTGFLRFLKT